MYDVHVGYRQNDVNFDLCLLKEKGSCAHDNVKKYSPLGVSVYRCRGSRPVRNFITAADESSPQNCNTQSPRYPSNVFLLICQTPCTFVAATEHAALVALRKTLSLKVSQKIYS